MYYCFDYLPILCHSIQLGICILAATSVNINFQWHGIQVSLKPDWIIALYH